MQIEIIKKGLFFRAEQVKHTRALNILSEKIASKKITHTSVHAYYIWSWRVAMGK